MWKMPGGVSHWGVPDLPGRIVLPFEARDTVTEMRKVIVWVLAHPCKVLQALAGVAFRVRLLQGAIRSPN